MSQHIELWFKELIKDKVTVEFQALGGYLDGTMLAGDVQANIVKFPVIGRTEVYKLTGAIEPVPVGNVGLSTVQVSMEDFEAAEWWRTQDAYKAGPSEKSALAKLLTYPKRTSDHQICAVIALFGHCHCPPYRCQFPSELIRNPRSPP